MEKERLDVFNKSLTRLIKNGYNSATASEFILEYVKISKQKQLDKISIALDDYLLNLLIGYIPRNNKFGVLKLITTEEIEEEKYGGVFYNYSCNLRDEIGYVIRSSKLRNIFNPDEYCIPKELEPYLHELFDPNNYKDLCELYIIGIKDPFYISLSSFKQLLKSKGITEDCYSIKGMETNNEGIYINSYKLETN